MCSVNDFVISPGYVVSKNNPCFVIAEIGQNHQGDIRIAKQLIDASKAAGANCVKFQKSCLSEKFNVSALNRPYSGQHSWGKTYGEHKKCLEFSIEDFKELQSYAKNIGIIFSASAMDCVSVDVLHDMNVPFLKIGSGDANNFPLLEYAASKNRPMVISTAGGAVVWGLHPSALETEAVAQVLCKAWMWSPCEYAMVFSHTPHITSEPLSHP